MMQKLARRIPRPRRPAAPSLPQARAKAAGAASADVDGFSVLSGAGGGWNRTEYGEYYATSTPVYAAIRLRADALTRPPVVVYRRTVSHDGTRRLPVGPDHPAQKLLERVNRWYTSADLWRATEIYLNLWGSAYWMLDRDSDGNREIWPLRPDRISIVPDRDDYIRGFVYHGRSRMIALTPDEVVWFRYFNPLEEYAGLSPVAPARLAVDMGKDGLRFNRKLPSQLGPARLRHAHQRVHERQRGRGLLPPLGGPLPRPRQRPPPRRRQLCQGHQDPRTQPSRHGLHPGTALEPRGGQPRLRGAPFLLLSDLERATFSNVNAAERFFWRNTMVPEMTFLAQQVTRQLFPLLGYDNLEVEFDLASIEALAEDENARTTRETQLLDRGVLTINEVRRTRNLPDVPWGNEWAKARG